MLKLKINLFNIVILYLLIQSLKYSLKQEFDNSTFTRNFNNIRLSDLFTRVLRESKEDNRSIRLSLTENEKMKPE